MCLSTCNTQKSHIWEIWLNGSLYLWYEITSQNMKRVSCDAIKMHSSFWETTAKRKDYLHLNWRNSLGSKAFSHQHTTAISFSAEPCHQNKSMPHQRQINGNRWVRLCSLTWLNSPLVYECKLAIDRTAGDKLSGLDVNVFGRLVGPVREEAAHHHQASQVWGILLRVTVWVQLAAQPTPHVSSAVEGAVSVSVYGHKNRKCVKFVNKMIPKVVIIVCKTACHCLQFSKKASFRFFLPTGSLCNNLC